jgi:transposase
MTMSCGNAGTSCVQRFEVFTGVGKPRYWPPEVKASIVADSYLSRENVSAVARRHSVSVYQLFNRGRLPRKQMEERGMALPAASRKNPLFVPGMIAPDEVPELAPDPRRSRRHRRAEPAPIELEIDGALVRIGHGADAYTIAAVIAALRRSR